MGKRLTIAEIKDRQKQHNDSVEILSDTYKNTRTPLLCKCKICGNEWNSKYTNLLKGYGCRKCSYKKIGEAKAYSLKEVQEQVAITSPLVEVIGFDFTNNVRKCKCKCKQCRREWVTKLNNLKQGKGCKSCSQKRGGKNFRLQIKEIQNSRDNLILLTQEYHNNKQPLNFKCKICGNEWVISWANLQKGRTCPYCRGTLLTIDIIKKRLKTINPNIEILSHNYIPNQKLKCKCNKCNYVWDITFGNLRIGHSCPKCAKKISKIEFSFLSNFNEWRKDREILQKNRELDAFFPDKKIAIEINGAFWHSEEQGKDKNYHLQKTKECEAKGIKLFHFFDSEIKNKEKICKSIINNALGNSIKLYARNCEVSEISAKEAREFCIENHIQGACIDKVRFGLFYDGELVSVMTFGKSRYDKSCEWELLRFCSKAGISIIGGASKLLKAFELSYNPKSLISYGNRRWCNSKNNVYDTLGFKLKGETMPNYFYFKDGLLYNRQNFQRHKLNKAFGYDFNPILTESEIMGLYGFSRVYDCGNLVYIKDFKC